MKGTLPKTNRSYIKAETGNRVWKYDVTGTPAEIKSFESAQEKVVINDETGNPIFFTTTFYGPSVELGISQKGSVYANTEQMDAVKDVMDQLGGAGAEAVAKELIGKLFSSAPSSSNVQIEAEEGDDQGLDI